MSQVRTYLKKRIDEEILLYYKSIDQYPQEKYDTLLKRWSDDHFFSESQRFDLLHLLIEDLKNKKILDMAAGCGSFTLQGLLKGYNIYGVEPEEWKHEVIDLKFKENDFNPEWRNHIVKGVGEKLPFEDESFDVFDSWQTIEHVAGERDCIFELYRVLRKGGAGILRGPSYLGFFEGHYHMFWLPGMGDGWLGKFFVQMMGRPLGGLKTFHPVFPGKIRRYAREAGFKVVNIKRKQIYNAIKRRMPLLKPRIFRPIWWSIYLIWDVYQGIKNFGRTESTISYLLIKDE